MRASDQTKRHLTRFLVTGTSSVLVDLTVYHLSAHSGASRELAKAAGYVAGLLLGFFLNKKWTFESREGLGREAIAYALLYAATFVVNVTANSAFIAFFNDHHAEKFSVALGFVFTTGITTILNYLGMRFIIFRRGIAAKTQASSP